MQSYLFHLLCEDWEMFGSVRFLYVSVIFSNLVHLYDYADNLVEQEDLWGVLGHPAN